MQQEVSKRRKKILFVITKSNFGGAQRYVYDMATNLPSESFDTTVAYGGNGTLGQMLHEKRVRTISISALDRDVKFVADVSAFLELINMFKRENPDVVHLNSSKAGGLGALAARLTGVPRIVFTSHGLAYDEDRSVIQKFLIYISTWITFLLCHAVICISKNNVARAKNMWLVKNKIYLVYNGIQSFQLLSKENARATLDTIINTAIPKDTFWIGTISELVRNKGLLYAIDACALFKKSGRKFAFLIIGSGDLHDTLAQQINKLHLGDSVFLLGFIPDARKYLRALDVFTLTSIKEGLPYVLLETAQAPVAVVASDIPGINDIVENNRSGILVAPRDSRAIADALERLAQNTKMREIMAQDLYYKVTHDFSTTSMINKTIELY